LRYIQKLSAREYAVKMINLIISEGEQESLYNSVAMEIERALQRG